MKYLLKTAFAAVLLSILFILSASAEGQVYTIDDKPSVFISDTEVITIDGTDYNAYPGLSEAFSALGADGGVIYVYGTVHDSTRTDLNRAPMDGTTAREHVLIRGWTSDAALHYYTTLNINAGPTTFENFTLYPTTTNGTADDTSDDTATATWYMTGSENTVFGEGFKINWVNQNSGSPRVYYRTFMSQDYTKNTNTAHRTVFASNSASFVGMGIGGYRDAFGSASSDVPALAEIVYDGLFLYGAVNAGFTDPADYQNRVYGNVNIYINGGNFYKKQVVLNNINETNYHTGRTTVIFNNGMNDANGWTIATGVDYVVNSVSGGTAEIKTQAPFGGVPVFKLTPDEEGKVPCIDGSVVIKENSDGEFLYTPEIPSESTDMVTTDNPEGTITETIAVTWVDKPEETVEPQVYTIDGKPTVFISDTEVITIDDTAYGAYPGLAEAFAALGADGGVIYVYGTVHDSTRTDLGRVAIDGTTAREHVLIRGWTSDAVLNFYTTLNINAGPTTFENFTLYPATTNGTADDTSDDTAGTLYMTGSENTVFGEGFKIPWVNQNSGSPRIYYRTFMSQDFTKNTNTVHRTVFGSSSASFLYTNIGGYRDSFGSASSTVPALAEMVYDGLFLYGAVNAGFSDAADYQNRVYGNVNLYINGGSFYNKQVKLNNINETNYHTGRTTVIFNNGMNDANDWTIATGVDYVVNSVAGGTTEIKTQAPFGGAPVFKLTPEEEGKVPCINGNIAISENDDGEFLYTPAIPGTSTDMVTTDNPEGTITETIAVTWIDKPEEVVEPQVYTISGKPTVFISDTQVIIENGMTYGAYPGLAEAFAALGENGGVIYVYGTVHDSTRTDLGRVAIDGTTAREHVLIRGWTSDAVLHFYTTLNINAGPTTFENFELHPAITNGTPDDTSDDTHGSLYMTGSENTVFGEGFIVKWVNQNSGSPRIYYRTYMSEDFTRNTNTEHRTVFASKDASILVTSIGGYRDSFGSASSSVPALAEMVFDNGFLFDAINAGFSDVADYQNRVYGNVNIYINGGSFYTKKINLSSINETNYHTGRTTVIFNNGMNTGWTIADGVDYVVNSAEGGTVEIFEQAPFGGAPTFRLVPENEGYTALLNGETILEIDEVEGCIFYTPDIPLESESAVSDTNPEGTVTEVLDIEWIEIPDTCVVSFDANGAEGDAPDSIECNYGAAYTLPGADEVELTMEDSVFLGWNTVRYASEALSSFTVPESETITLYAIWQHNGVTLTEGQNLSDKGIGGIRVSTVNADEFESNESVIAAVAALENEALNIAGFEAVYAFEVKVFDTDEDEVSSYNKASFDIALSVLPELSAGECYVIYREDDFIDFSKNADRLVFSDTESGVYTVAVMNAKTATYTYKLLSYNKNSGEYALALYFDGADASYGTFGLGYDAEKLEFVSFTPSSDVVLTGSEEGFGTYLSENGIYRNTWEAANGSFINAADTQVEIGRFLFNAKSEITDNNGLFAKAYFADAETVLPEGVAETVYDTDENVYLYAPMVPSSYVYCQPTTEVFDLEAEQTESEVTVKIATEREFGKASVSNAVITILSGDETVLSLSENDTVAAESSDGKTVLEFSADLMPGEYTLKIQKNGYLTYTSAFTVDSEGATLPDITLICGDIKGDINDVCGDGVVDIDDFIRVLRGFSDDVSEEVRTAVDLNEDGNVNVTDIAIIKKNFGERSGN